ncbi:MAG: hydroxymethylbilane synthase [Verrucomicrobiae bacterium]|nr:hydroxymethylbilane synthase [Verrucomicrobiae bacterium]
MPQTDRPIILATRGSPLALAQSNQMLAACREAFPELRFELRIIKTTGDRLQKASMANPAANLPKGLFTKELEVALLANEADFAVHSLKDLPTELPTGLVLGAVPGREDVRDALIYRSELGAVWQPAVGEGGEPAEPVPPRRHYPAGLTLDELPKGATIATSSTRRREQLLACRRDLKIVEIRGNVGTRLEKLLRQPELDGMLLAAAGLKRLGYELRPDGSLACRSSHDSGDDAPVQEVPEFRVSLLGLDVMLPCVGQAALGIEVRADDERMAAVCRRLNHEPSHQCVTAERAFLHAMGGGCQSPVAAHAELVGDRLRLRAVSFRTGERRVGERSGPATDAGEIGKAMAGELM